MGRGYLSKVNKFHQFLMYRNFATEMSCDRNGQTESARPNRPDRIGQTETAQTETARPKSRVPVAEMTRETCWNIKSRWQIHKLKIAAKKEPSILTPEKSIFTQPYPSFSDENVSIWEGYSPVQLFPFKCCDYPTFRRHSLVLGLLLRWKCSLRLLSQIFCFFSEKVKKITDFSVAETLKNRHPLNFPQIIAVFPTFYTFLSSTTPWVSWFFLCLLEHSDRLPAIIFIPKVIQHCIESRGGY